MKDPVFAGVFLISSLFAMSSCAHYDSRAVFRSPDNDCRLEISNRFDKILLVDPNAYVELTCRGRDVPTTLGIRIGFTLTPLFVGTRFARMYGSFCVVASEGRRYIWSSVLLPQNC